MHFGDLDRVVDSMDQALGLPVPLRWRHGEADQEPSP